MCLRILLFVLGVFVARRKNFSPKCTDSTIEEPREVIRWLVYR